MRLKWRARPNRLTSTSVNETCRSIEVLGWGVAFSDAKDDLSDSLRFRPCSSSVHQSAADAGAPRGRQNPHGKEIRRRGIARGNADQGHANGLGLVLGE